MPAPKVAISREHLGTRAGHAIQEQTKRVAQAVNAATTPNIIEGVRCVPSTTITVAHNLGRPWVGWRFARIYSWDGTPGTTPQLQDNGHVNDDQDSRIITFGAFATFTADIEVF